MARKKNKNIEYDIPLAISSADSFRAISQAYTKTLKGLSIQDTDKLGTNMGTVIGSATNLALSVELYLKSIYMINGMSVPVIHHLWSLYKNLPIEATQSIKRTYDNLNSNQNGDLAALRIYTAKGRNKEFDPPAEVRKVGPSDIKSVLVRSSDAFSTWRYFYERDGNPEWQMFEYEFHRLNLVCEATRSYAVNALQPAHA